MCKRFCEKDYDFIFLSSVKNPLHEKCWYYVQQLVVVVHFILSLTETFCDGVLWYSVK
jgi:hypothetical protein